MRLYIRALMMLHPRKTVFANAMNFRTYHLTTQTTGYNEILRKKDQSLFKSDGPAVTHESLRTGPPHNGAIILAGLAVGMKHENCSLGNLHVDVPIIHEEIHIN